MIRVTSQDAREEINIISVVTLNNINTFLSIFLDGVVAKRGVRISHVTLSQY